MRKDNRDRFVAELLDAALASHHNAEPRAGLEERALANLRQQPRMARWTHSVSRNSASVMIAVAALLAFFAVEHLMNHRAAPDPTIAASNEPRAGAELNLTARRTKEAVVSLPAKRVKVATKSAAHSFHRQDLAVNHNWHNWRRADEQANGGLRVDEVRIAEVRLDEIVISGAERHE